MPTAMVNGTSLYYTVQGHGIPIIFVHPPVLTSMSFNAQLQGLAKRYTTIGFDIRGHGRSSETQETLTYQLIASDIRALMQQLHVKHAFLCGYSTGGAVILEFMLRYPELAYGGIVIGGMSEVHDLRLRTRISLGMMLAKIGALSPLALGLTWTNSRPQEFWRSFKEARRGNSRNAEEYYRASLTYNCTERLIYLKRPVLLVYGEGDKGFHAYAQLLHHLLPRNQLVFVKNVKHQIPVKATDILNQHISQFVDDCTSDIVISNSIH